MLITQSGFRMFTDYDLGDSLRNLIENIKNHIESDKTILVSNEEEYITKKVQQNTQELTILSSDKISVSQKECLIDSRYFPSNFFVDQGESYPKPVLTFQLPFKGDALWFQCRPSTFMLWTEEVLIKNDSIIFEVINFSDDVEAVKRERDGFVRSLQGQVENINKEIMSFNSNLDGVIRASVQKAKDKFKKQGDFLSSLGNTSI